MPEGDNVKEPIKKNHNLAKRGERVSKKKNKKRGGSGRTPQVATQKDRKKKVVSPKKLKQEGDSFPSMGGQGKGEGGEVGEGKVRSFEPVRKPVRGGKKGTQDFHREGVVPSPTIS